MNKTGNWISLVLLVSSYHPYGGIVHVTQSFDFAYLPTSAIFAYNHFKWRSAYLGVIALHSFVYLCLFVET